MKSWVNFRISIRIDHQDLLISFLCRECSLTSGLDTQFLVLTVIKIRIRFWANPSGLHVKPEILNFNVLLPGKGSVHTLETGT